MLYKKFKKQSTGRIFFVFEVQLDHTDATCMNLPLAVKRWVLGMFGRCTLVIASSHPNQCR